MALILIPVILIFAEMAYDLVFNAGANLVVLLATFVFYSVPVFGCGVGYNRRGINPAVRGPLDDPDR